jgi:hypothetical protein
MFDECAAAGDPMGTLGRLLLDMPALTVFGAAQRLDELNALLAKERTFRFGKPLLVLDDEVAHAHAALGEMVDASAAANFACMDALEEHYVEPALGEEHPCLFFYNLNRQSVIGEDSYQRYESLRKGMCDGR